MTNTMTPGAWATDARRARHEAAQAATCARCDGPGQVSSVDLGTLLCVPCHDSFIEWDRRNPAAYYEDFLTTTDAPILAGAQAGEAMVGALLLVAALAAMITGVIVGFASPLFSGGHLIAAPLLVVGGGVLAWFVLTPARVTR